MSNLNYKCLGGDLLVFKNLNDCMTINRLGGSTWINSIEVMGEELEYGEFHPDNPFTKDEMEYWLKEYKNTDAGKC